MSEPIPAPEELLLVGTIVAAFGVRGQVKMRAYTAHIEHLQQRIKIVYVGKQRTPYRLGNLFEHKPGLLVVSLQGVTTREQAEDLRGSDVSIREREAVPLAEDEYFLHQLYGLRVELADGTLIGSVREVLETGANEVLVVTRPNQPDALIPMIRAVIAQLDFANQRIVITPLEGLL